MNELTTTHAFSTNLRARIKAKYSKMPQHICLLLDISGSMAGEAIIKLRQVVDGFTNVRRIEFNDYIKELQPTEHISDADGGTNMAKAFRFCKAHGIKHIVMVTDGLPDDEGRALRDAVGLRIDVRYIGPQPPPQFLSDLAKATGGNYGTDNIDHLKELTTTLRGLLPAPSGPIEL
jgi:hypothetical protein